jgi:hypothetical protein
VRASDKSTLSYPNRPLLDEKISGIQQRANSIHWLSVMAKESSKSTEEAIMNEENRQNLAGISKIDRNSAITHSSKSTEEAITEIDHNLAIMREENRHNLAGISNLPQPYPG